MSENRIFVAKKPMFISSNNYLQRLKRRLGVKKAGYSGTLDPFASGVLLVACGSYTRLFDHIKIEPKVYRATLWLGLHSDSLDIENVERVEQVECVSEESILRIMEELHGEIAYIPPKYCAKKINGKRAYELARSGENVELQESKMRVDSIRLIDYNHPFIAFEATVSKGAYVRSLGEMIAKNLGVKGALSSLERVSEGGLIFEDFKSLDPLVLLPYKRLELMHLYNDFALGRKLSSEQVGNPKNGIYTVEFEEFFSIIDVNEGRVSYLLNRMERC
ncbi:MAG: tRNA pseudouridine(55) synthase TruB [Wolinella sp.]